MNTTAPSLLIIAVCATLTVLGADYALGRVVQIPPPEYETVDGLADYARGDPHILALGSSYARSFAPIAEELAESTPARRMAVMPIEGGKFVAYDWLLRHRLAALIDQQGERGDKLRPSLEQIVVITNFWDACDVGARYANLPSRAWAFSDFALDVAREGITAFNSNYIDQRWSELTGWSTLTRDRGVGRILRQLRERYLPKSQAELAERDAARLVGALSIIENNGLDNPDCKGEDERAALDDIVAFAQERGLKLSFVLWPMLPNLLTPRGEQVVAKFEELMTDVQRVHGAQLYNFHYATPLVATDFRKDLDHLEPWGEAKLARWALSGPLSELRQPLARPASEALSTGRKLP